MPRIIIKIGLPAYEGCPDQQIAIVTKKWLCTSKSPFRSCVIPHTNDKCDRLVLVCEDHNRWSISFECKTEHLYESNTVVIDASKDLCISCAGRGLDRVPKGSSQRAVEEFVRVLLKNGWDDEKDVFEHLQP